MPETPESLDARLLRLRGQRLLPMRPAPTVPAAASAIADFRAQFWPEALLGVRSWFMRTLHLVATEDFGWLLGLLGPGQIAAGRRRREGLGLDQATCALAVSVLEAELAEGPRTRAEIDDALVACG